MLYSSVNMSHKMLLKNKLTSTHMSKTDIVASYVIQVTELRDQLATIGKEIDEKVQITLNGFGPS